MSSLKIAITGANGMLGVHIVQKLQSDGHQVFEVDRNVWDIEQNSDGSGFSFLNSCDVVVHCAAITPEQNTLDDASIIAINVAASSHLAQWCSANNKHLIYIGGAGCYRETSKINLTESDEKTHRCLGGAYGLSKYMAELAIRQLTNDKCTVFRPSSLYGTGMPENRMVAKFILNASAGIDLEVVGGNSRVNLLHCADVAGAVSLAVQGREYGVFNLASDSHVSFREVAETVVRLTGSKSKVVSGDIEGQVTQDRLLLDANKAKDALGYRPKFSLVQGIQCMLNEQLI